MDQSLAKSDEKGQPITLPLRLTQNLTSRHLIPVAWEAEVGESQVEGQFRKLSETLSQNKKQKDAWEWASTCLT